MDWTIRPATVEDAERIAECYKQTYPDNYPWPQFFDPEQVAAMISQQGTLCYVIEQAHDIIGTGSVVLNGSKAELGRAVIRPDFRGIRNGEKSPFSDLILVRTEAALEHGAQLVYSAAVTAHARSQRTLHRHGYEPCAFEPGKYPEVFMPQRESTIIMVYNGSTFEHGHDIHAPEESHNLVQRITNALKLNRTVTNGAPEEHTLNVTIDIDKKPSQHAIATVTTGGQLNVHDACDKLEETRREHGLQYVQVHVAADSPAALALHNRLGYSVTGFLPHWIPTPEGNKDALVMTYVNKPIDLRHIQTTPGTKAFIGSLTTNPGKPWRIRRAQAADAEDIATCFKQSWAGTNYPFTIFYDPDRVRELLKAPDTLTNVIEQDGTIIGTGSVVLNGNKAELGRACIRPSYQGLKHDHESAFEDLINHRTKQAFTAGANIVYSCSVTGHPKSLITLERAGYNPCATELGKYPELFMDQRESTIIMVYRKSQFSDGQTIILPKEAIPVTERNITMLGIDRTIRYEGTEPRTVDVTTSLDAETSRHAKYTITPGTQMSIQDACELIHTNTKEHHLTYNQIEIAADTALPLSFYNTLTPNGYHISGYVPNWIHGTDALLLEKCENPIDISRISKTIKTQDLIEKLNP